MARGKGRGKGRGRVLSGQGRTGGECSTSVESSSQFSQDMQFPVPSALGLTRGRKGKNQTAKLYASDNFFVDNYGYDRRKAAEISEDETATEIDNPAGKPGKKLRKK